MRKPRVKGFPEWEESFYHCKSRIVSEEFHLTPREKEHFTRLMQRYEIFSGIQIIAFCVLDCHFHVFVRVPKRPPTHLLPDDDELVQRVRMAGCSYDAATLRQDLERLRQSGAHQAAEELREQFFCRMWDVTWFMRILKQRFTQWYNKLHGRSGTLWDGRFKSVLVEGTSHMLTLVSVRIDMNPVRMGLVRDPAKYRWCGYAEAMASGRRALEAIAFLNDPERCALGHIDRPFLKESLEMYRREFYLFGAQKEEAYTPDGYEPGRVGFTDEEIHEVLSKGGKVSERESSRCRFRYFSDGVAIGGKVFVEKVFDGIRPWFAPNRETGARKIKGINADDLYCLRNLRKRIFG